LYEDKESNNRSSLSIDNDLVWSSLLSYKCNCTSLRWNNYHYSNERYV